MKLSEAIRLGAMMGPPTHDRWTGKDGSSCVVGAALLSAGIVERPILSKGFREVFLARFPIVEHLPPCPQCGEDNIARHGGSNPIHWGLQHLFHEHRWSREDIADFVETIEREQEPATEPELAREEVCVG